MLIDDLKKTINDKDYWALSHYVDKDERGHYPKNSWLVRREVEKDDK
jgi:hypothetical protein